MCGICGILYFGRERNVEEALLRKMCASIIHRGPDDEGILIDKNIGIGIRRLSIIDLTAGHQPIHNEDETVWIICNGEIYNYKEIRKELKEAGHRFYTNSDTEVIVHLYEEFGENCVQRLNGMFAFSIWDKRKKRLFAARDRLGVKPFYYSIDKEKFIFGSEIKAILEDKEINREVDPQALNDYLTFRYVPCPLTMFKGIRKLPPGHLIIIDEGKFVLKEYWDLKFSVDRRKTEADFASELLERLEESVKKRLMSDVPLGVFLSGGLDSSAITGLMSRLVSEPVKTFSVAFDGHEDCNELDYARQISDLYHTDHHELVIDHNDFTAFLPGFIWHMDEPVADPASIPLYYISKLAKNYVTVLLSGEGGDEVLAGYSYWKVVLYQKLQSIYEKFPGFFKKTVNAINEKTMRINFFKRSNLPAEKRDLYSATGVFDEEEKKIFCTERLLGVAGIEPSWNILRECFNKVKDESYLNKILYLDTKTWLPEELLMKADKMTMATSVELRVPFLDYTFVEFCATIPPSLKTKIGVNKYIFKKAVSSFVPKGIIKRKKMGFPVPISAWFRKELKEYTADILLSGQSTRRGYFRSEKIRQILEEHWSCAFDHSLKIWNLLVLELWFRTYMD